MKNSELLMTKRQDLDPIEKQRRYVLRCLVQENACPNCGHKLNFFEGADIAIDSVGGVVTGEALSSLGLGGVLIILGYSAGRKTLIDVTDLIWKGARMAGFSLFAQPPTAIAAAWREIVRLVVGGSIKPVVERVYPLSEAGEALRHLIEDRPFGKVILAG